LSQSLELAQRQESGSVYYVARQILDKPSTVLIVDDDPSHLKIYSWVIERGGFQSLSALVQSDDVNFPEAEAVDLVVLDYRLGGNLTAVDVAKRLRAIYPSVPIVILSDLYGMPDDIAPYASAFVRKGEPQQLLDTIGSTMRAA
jgi:CheY-like chemotaxis protein